MGCDAISDDDGLFTIEIRDYETSRVIGVVSHRFPNARHRIAIEILDGDSR